jgi:hypothetical protein
VADLKRSAKMKITDFLILSSDGGAEIRADAFGNNVAFSCRHCGHPVLATALENQRGSDEAHPSKCRGCGRGYFLEIRPQAQKLYIHEEPNQTSEPTSGTGPFFP